MAAESKGVGLSSLTNCVRILWEPGRVFAEITERPAIWAPYLFWMLLATVAGLISLPHLVSMTPTTDPSTATAIAYVGAVFRGCAGPWLKGPIYAAVLMGLGLFTESGMRFKAYMAVAGYAQVPLLIGGIINAFMTLSVHTVAEASKLSLGPQVFFPGARGLGYAFLHNLDLFGIWSLGLLVLGFAACQRKRASQAVWVGLIWFVAGMGMTWVGTLLTPQ